MSKRDRLMLMRGCVVLAVVLAVGPAANAQESPDADTPYIDLNAPAPTPTPQPTEMPQSATAATDKSVEPQTEVSADEVLREFQLNRPAAEPLRPQAPGTSLEPRTPSEESQGAAGLRRMPDGSMLVDRSGRLVREGMWWTITFVGDNNPNETPDPPMKLLPNQMLERAVRETQEGTRSVEFIVSGEVTDFMGENFLLLRKLMRKREMGNLSS